MTGDGCCGLGFNLPFVLLLKLLEENKILSRYISANYDEDGYYNEVNRYSENLKYTQEISNKTRGFNVFKILGDNYYQSKSKSQLKSATEDSHDNYDIVITQSQLKRRIRLFKINTDYTLLLLVLTTLSLDYRLLSLVNRCFRSSCSPPLQPKLISDNPIIPSCLEKRASFQILIQ